jgi:2',3'-cyclic-nucleotide 2'-phosphodiesterase (5'-nucleotidase family)
MPGSGSRGTRAVVFGAVLAFACQTGADANRALHVVKLTANPHGRLELLFGIQGDITVPKLAFDASAAMLERPIGSRTGHLRLTILHINDLHNHIVDFAANGEIYRAARIAKLVGERRRGEADDEVVLFLSGGDDHIGTIFDELLGDEPARFQTSAAYTALSAIGLDAAVVGNHEFDKGTSILSAAIKQDAAFPVLCSNIHGSKRQLPCFRALIGTAGEWRIGLIGLVTPDDIYLHPDEDPGLDAADPLPLINRLLPAIVPYADVIIFLNHLGYGGGIGDGTVNRHAIRADDLAVARAAADLTDKPVIVVGGHTHSALNRDGLEPQNVINNVAVVQAGEYGKWLGEATLEIDRTGTGWKWKNAAHLMPMSEAVSMKGATPDATADHDLRIQANVIEPIVARVLNILQRVVWRSDDSPDLSVASTAIDRYIGESAMANFIADAMVAGSRSFAGGRVDLAAINATALRGIPLGANLTYKDIYDAMPYADTIYVFELTGRQIQDVLDDNARRLFLTGELVCGGGRLDPMTYLERGFLHFSAGLRYWIRVGAAPGEGQVEDLTVFGVPIRHALETKYRIALPSYLAHGRAGWNGGPIGGGLSAGLSGYDLKSLATEGARDTGLTIRSALIDHLEAKGGLIGVTTGGRKDGRVQISSSEHSPLPCE